MIIYAAQPCMHVYPKLLLSKTIMSDASINPFWHSKRLPPIAYSPILSCRHHYRNGIPPLRDLRPRIPFPSRRSCILVLELIQE
jgi:hypothetical protein